MKQSKIVLLIVFCILNLRLFALKPIRGYVVRPNNYNLIYKEVNFSTSDGVTLKGWFLPAQKRVEEPKTRDELLKNVALRKYQTKDLIKRPTIIICDGDAGNMLYNIWLAEEYVFNDFNVFLFDWRGFGESEKWHINENYLVYTEFLKDYNAAVDFVKNQSEVDVHNISLLGYSTGAYLSWIVGSQRNDIKNLIVRGLMTDFNEFLKELSKIQNTKDIIIPSDFPINLMPKYSVVTFKIPCFIIVGAKDKRTPPWMSKEIYTSLHVRKKIWVVKNAEHGGGKSPEVIAEKEFYRKTLKFLKD
jgi:alpha-beta hydrolase superfamily lysophospholipase